jgi:uncharacterized protein (UPF0248 family)
MDLRDMLNARRWRDGDLDRVEIDVVHRGAPGDQRTVYGDAITAVVAEGVRLRASHSSWAAEDETDDGEVFIPFHRMIRVRHPDGTLWEKQ